MHIISNVILRTFWTKHPQSENGLKKWAEDVRKVVWAGMNELKAQFGNASVITGKRVIFNIKGNDYRLIVDVEFVYKAVYIVWVGTHKEYDRIDAKTVVYEDPRN